MSQPDISTNAGLAEACALLSGQPEGLSERQRWIEAIADTIVLVRSADAAERATREFQYKLWEANQIAAVGKGNISIEQAVDDAAFRQWLATRSMQPLPASEGDRVAFLTTFYEEIIGRLKPILSRQKVPRVKIIRLICALYPETMTTVASRRALRHLTRVMGSDALDTMERHVWVRGRLDAALGPAGLDPHALAERISLAWRLYERYVAATEADAGGAGRDDAEDDDRPSADEVEPIAAVALTTPRALFSKVDYELGHVLASIDAGEIGLPDLQRPFVWSASRVRDLFDSMYRGFPVGYLLFWSNTELQNARSIGVEPKQRKIPRLVIVDGQQRLTSLYAVLRGRTVCDDDFQPFVIEIAFRPRDGQFAVTDAAIRRNPEFIASVSDVWAPGATSWSVINGFFAQLEARRPVSADDKQAMSRNLDRLFDLQRYSFTALEIMPEVAEEAIAEIFVRINSQGVKLNQSDFLLTLLSVFWPEGRLALETFSRQARVPPAAAGGSSPFNYLIQPSPDQMLRVSVATGFHRARLKSVYQVLRGKDIETDRFSETLRDQQFARLRDAQHETLNLNYWHDYLACLRRAGYRGGEMISSENAVIYGYAMYLIGRLQAGVRQHALAQPITRWFVMNSITGRYSGSTESVMENDLNRVRTVRSPDEFFAVVDQIVATTLTADFWRITLPADLESSSVRAPAFLAFLAAQCVAGAPVLFSDKRVVDVLDPALRPARRALDLHHLFPKAWLKDQGVVDKTAINQVANLAYVEWPENLSIKAASPRDYVPALRDRFSEHQWVRMSQSNALPADWHLMEYEEFLRRRRALMAELTHRWFDELSRSRAAEGATLDEGNAEERAAWTMIEQVERRLRALIRRRFSDEWHTGADGRMRSILGEQAMATIDRNRAKYETQYALTTRPDLDPILDFCYLGQLIQLMVAGPAWQLFRTAFDDKRQLEDLAKAIIPVRNDAAHFRSVPELELLRSRVAVSDLVARLNQLEAGTAA